MFKNLASQYITVMAWDVNASAYKTGDAANITAYLSKDAGAAVQSNDINPTEIDATNQPGAYRFALTQAETNANLIEFIGKSTTSGIIITPVILYTVSSAITISGLSSQALNSLTNQGQKVEIYENNKEVNIPYDLDSNLTGKTVYFAARKSLSQATYDIFGATNTDPKNITSYVVSAADGTGNIFLDADDLVDLATGSYYAELWVTDGANLVASLLQFELVIVDSVRIP